MQRGKVLMAQEEYRKALDDFRKAVELAPALAREADSLIAQCRTTLGQ